MLPTQSLASCACRLGKPEQMTTESKDRLGTSVRPDVPRVSGRYRKDQEWDHVGVVRDERRGVGGNVEETRGVVGDARGA